MPLPTTVDAQVSFALAPPLLQGERGTAQLHGLWSGFCRGRQQWKQQWQWRRHAPISWAQDGVDQLPVTPVGLHPKVYLNGQLNNTI